MAECMILVQRPWQYSAFMPECEMSQVIFKCGEHKYSIQVYRDRESHKLVTSSRPMNMTKRNPRLINAEEMVFSLLEAQND